jgi:hypothetical protein
MFRLGIIEESILHKEVLEIIQPYFFSQRMEHVPADEYPIWHINEYHIPEEKIIEFLDILKESIEIAWYIHAFNETVLYVAMHKKFFALSLKRDQTWNEMIEYGVSIAQVEKSFLENIPLHI